MIRAVLDTHVLVSYLLTQCPPVSTLIADHLPYDRFRPVTTPELLVELDRILAYPKLQQYYAGAERTRFVAPVLALSEVVDLPETLPRI